MSDLREEAAPKDRAPTPPEPDGAGASSPNTTAQSRSARSPRAIAALWLAVLLILAIGSVASAPFWAAAVMPLLPWGAKPAADDYDALAARIAALEQRPIPPPTAVEAIKSAQAELAQRIAALEAARQNQGAGETAAVARLTQRLDALEAQSTARAAGDAAELQKIRQALARRDTAQADLADRLAALEHRVQSNADRGGSVLLLALLQMRAAVEEGRPFPAEYAAFTELAAHDPDLAAAAKPLADAARDGVASRSVLRQRLAVLADQVATLKAPAASSEWWGRALDRLRGLVTIRHIDGAAKTGPQAAVAAARSALAGGDLAASIAALDKLNVADAEAAQPWLQMARQRLAAETALTRLQELLTARLGPAPAAPSPAPAPPAPAQPSAPRTPS